MLRENQTLFKPKSIKSLNNSNHSFSYLQRFFFCRMIAYPFLDEHVCSCVSESRCYDGFNSICVHFFLN